MYKLLWIVLLFPLCAFAGVELPSEYAGITIYQSKLDDVLNNFGDSQLQSVPDGHHDEGYCYNSTEGISTVFSSGPMGDNYAITQISIHSGDTGMKCSSTAVNLPQCLGKLCLGMSKSEAENVLAGEFEYYYGRLLSKDQYLTRALSDQDRYYLNLPAEITVADITHYIRVEFENGKAAEIGVIKFETF